jgi:phenylacetate-CoA ligase
MPMADGWFPRAFLRRPAPHDDLGRTRIVEDQNRRLRRVIAHARERVPYYRKLFDEHGVDPDAVTDRTGLSSLPLTNREDLQALPAHDLLAAGVNAAHLLSYTTSGSSGRPFTIRRTWAEERRLAAFRMRAMREHGLRFTDREANIRNLEHTGRWHTQRTIRALQAMGLFRKIWLDCRLPAEDIFVALQRYDPDVLIGLPHVLSRVAAIVASAGRRTIRPRFVTVGGEVLTPLMRRQISDALHARVFNQYGSFECNLIAWECEETGQLHLCDDGVIVEVLNGDKPARTGETGEVVVTNLHAFAMPFIRYRLGDIATQGFERCPCGRPYATITDVQGRMVDYFHLAGGRWLHPYVIGDVLSREAGWWLRHYQVTQERTDRIVLRAVAAPMPSRERLAELTAAVTAVLGAEIAFQVRLVSEIEIEPSGKFRVYRSLVQESDRSR